MRRLEHLIDLVFMAWLFLSGAAALAICVYAAVDRAITPICYAPYQPPVCPHDSWYACLFWHPYGGF